MPLTSAAWRSSRLVNTAAVPGAILWKLSAAPGTDVSAVNTQYNRARIQSTSYHPPARAIVHHLTPPSPHAHLMGEEVRGRMGSLSPPRRCWRATRSVFPVSDVHWSEKLGLCGYLRSVLIWGKLLLSFDVQCSGREVVFGVTSWRFSRFVFWKRLG